MSQSKTFGGVLQVALVRFTLLDATDHHPAGSYLYTDHATRVTYGRRWRDGTYTMRVALCMPDPTTFEFVIGGSVLRDNDGTVVGWREPDHVRDARFAIDAWSANVWDGAVQGYYRWSAPECAPMSFVGHALDGRHPAEFRAATTVDLKRGLHFYAEDELPHEGWAGPQRTVRLPQAVSS